jgi:hypothetical protein
MLHMTCFWKLPTDLFPYILICRGVEAFPRFLRICAVAAYVFVATSLCQLPLLRVQRPFQMNDKSLDFSSLQNSRILPTIIF